jgi:hypothetical protein
MPINNYELERFAGREVVTEERKFCPESVIFPPFRLRWQCLPSTKVSD